MSDRKNQLSEAPFEPRPDSGRGVEAGWGVSLHLDRWCGSSYDHAGFYAEGGR